MLSFHEAAQNSNVSVDFHALAAKDKPPDPRNHPLDFSNSPAGTLDTTVDNLSTFALCSESLAVAGSPCAKVSSQCIVAKKNLSNMVNSSLSSSILDFQNLERKKSNANLPGFNSSKVCCKFIFASRSITRQSSIACSNDDVRVSNGFVIGDESSVPEDIGCNKLSNVHVALNPLIEHSKSTSDTFDLVSYANVIDLVDCSKHIALVDNPSSFNYDVAESCMIHNDASIADVFSCDDDIEVGDSCIVACAKSSILVIINVDYSLNTCVENFSADCSKDILNIILICNPKLLNSRVENCANRLYLVCDADVLSNSHLENSTNNPINIANIYNVDSFACITRVFSVEEGSGVSTIAKDDGVSTNAHHALLANHFGYWFFAKIQVLHMLLLHLWIMFSKIKIVYTMYCMCSLLVDYYISYMYIVCVHFHP